MEPLRVADVKYTQRQYSVLLHSHYVLLNNWTAVIFTIFSRRRSVIVAAQTGSGA